MRRLEFGDVLDAGYGEIMVTPEYAQVLLNGAMSHVNGDPVSLKIVDRGLTKINAVIVRVLPAVEQAAALEVAA